MDSLPVEVLNAICALVSNVAAFRLVTKDFAAIGAPYLVKRVQFHACLASVNRLTEMSNHPIFSQSVRTLHWEATRLQPDITLRELMRFMQNDPARAKRSPGASEREYRLFQRNLRKRGAWERKIESLFREYQALVKSQKHAETTLQWDLKDTIWKFSSLKEVYFNNEPDSLDRFSQRFRSRFHNFDKVLFPALFDHHTTFSAIRQTRDLLFGIAYSKSAVEKLVVSHLEPWFFPSLSPYALTHIYNAVSTLKHISIRFHGHCSAILNRGGLRDMLAASPLLEHLEVSFDNLPKGDNIALTDVLGDVAWPRLKHLLISNLSTTEDEFMACLTRQNSLEDVSLDSMTLIEGSWENTLQRMQKNLLISVKFGWIPGE